MVIGHLGTLKLPSGSGGLVSVPCLRKPLRAVMPLAEGCLGEGDDGRQTKVW